MEEILANVQAAWQSMRKIQQIIDVYLAGEWSPPGTDLIKELTPEDVQFLKNKFNANKTIVIDSLTDINV